MFDCPMQSTSRRRGSRTKQTPPAAERVAGHGAGFYGMSVREFDTRGMRSSVGHVDRVGTGAGRGGEAQGRCQQEGAFHGRQWLR